MWSRGEVWLFAPSNIGFGRLLNYKAEKEQPDQPMVDSDGNLSVMLKLLS